VRIFNYKQFTKREGQDDKELHVDAKAVKYMLLLLLLLLLLMLLLLLLLLMQEQMQI
jgi:hypothetical protein